LINNKGFPIPGINTDIDNVPRNSGAPDIGAKEFELCDPDAGINYILEPENPVSNGVHSIKVRLQNHGTLNLTSAIINWKVNNEVQTPYMWSGNLAGNNYTDIEIGTYDFTGGYYNFKVWTSQPNGENDCSIVNDTAIIKVASTLCGIYTIGGINPDFQNFYQATEALSLAGVNCPVTFKVRDGEYNEQVLINYVPGSSNINTVTFESESADSTSVTIKFDIYPGPALKLKTAKHIRFKRIGIEGYSSVFVDSYSSDIIIDACKFNFDEWGIGIRSGSNNVEIKNSYFLGGNHGIYMSPHDGIISASPKDISINNNVLNPNYSATYMENVRDVSIVGNEVYGSRTGFYLNSTNIIRISSNRVNISSKYDWHNSAIKLEYCDTINVYNNYLTSKGDFKSYGIFSHLSSHTDIYFNSINITNTDLGSESYGIKIVEGEKFDIKNNILNNKYAGSPIYINWGAQNYTLDYNDYHNPYGQIGQLGDDVYFSLSQWADAVNGDGNSLSENPFYISDTDLSMNQILLNNRALPIAGIENDIDGTPRNTSQPDIGAKEYNPCLTDAGINKLASPGNPISAGNQEVRVVLQNQGSATLNSVIINWRVNGEQQSPFVWSGNLGVNSNVEVNLGNYTFEGGLYKFSAWTSQPNGELDCNPYNDTITVSRASSLCGVYTIGGDSPDFETFTEAAEVLYIAGVNCAVVFKVRDGEYNEKFAINNVPGSSEINTITFESESADSTAVLITYSNFNYSTVRLKNAKHIRFKHIGIQGHFGLFIDDKSKDVVIDACLLNIGEWGIAIRSGSNNINVVNNYFENGNHGVFITPSDGNISIIPENIKISNNIFNQNYSATYLEYGRNIKISGNKVNNTRVGFYAHDTKLLTIDANTVNTTSQSDWINSGIHIERCDTVSIYNNYLSTNGDCASNGIYSYLCSDLRVYFNSLDIRNTDPGHESHGLKMLNANKFILKNNILNIKYYGNPIYIDEYTLDYILDYNNYYSPTALVGRLGSTKFYNLDDWGNAVNGDANSKNINPYFVSDTNPLPYQRELNGAGIPVTGILLDINGLIRNDQAPDVGCIEFTVDFGITDLLNPSLDCFHAGSENVTIYLRQFGDIPFIDLKLAYQVNGGEVHTDMVPGTIYNDLEFTFNADINISSEGEYIFKIWLINTLDDNVNNDTLTVIRYSKPAPEVSAYYENKCSWKEVTFNGSASVTDPYFIDGYEWLFGDGEVSNQQNPIHFYDSVGNYDAIFRAYSNAGCYSADTLDVFIDPDYEPLTIDFDLHKEICDGDGDGYLIISGSGGSPPYSYYLNNAELQNTRIDNISTGEYIFNIADSEQCEFMDTVFVSPAVYMNPIIIPEPDSGYAPLEVYFDLLSNDADSFLWQFDNGSTSTVENPYFLYEEYGEHIVNVIVNSGEPYYCEEYDTAIIFVDVNVSINAPNVFTPNSDGINDYFVIETNGIEDMTTYIYDRQGIKLAELDGVENAWDGKTKSGKEVPDGVYYYFVEAVGFNKLNYHKEGSVILLKTYAAANPNPARDVLNVETYGLNDGNLNYEIFDVNSNLVWSIKTDNQKVISIDISSLEDGIYIIKICDNSNCISKKFIKNNY